MEQSVAGNNQPCPDLEELLIYLRQFVKVVTSACPRTAFEGYVRIGVWSQQSSSTTNGRAPSAQRGRKERNTGNSTVEAGSLQSVQRYRNRLRDNRESRRRQGSTKKSGDGSLRLPSAPK